LGAKSLTENSVGFSETSNFGSSQNSVRRLVLIDASS
jgi:hypothetical protein